MPDIRPRALIADGDRLTRLLISRHLTAEGFDIGECNDGREALERITASCFDLIVLDGAMNGLDGIALCRTIRHNALNAHAAVFVVAMSDDESDTVLALANGADGYLTKPLRMREFVARVSAVMRRMQCVRHGPNTRNPIDRDDLRLDPARRQVLVRGRSVACSKQEFELLYALASAPGMVFSREELLAGHWPSSATASARDGKGDPAIRLVDPIISRLRRKIERESDSPRMIITVWGIGYKFAD